MREFFVTLAKMIACAGLLASLFFLPTFGVLGMLAFYVSIYWMYKTSKGPMAPASPQGKGGFNGNAKLSKRA